MDTAPKIELLAKTVVCGGMHTAALTEDVRERDANGLGARTG